MRKITTITIILIYAVSIHAADLRSYRDTPLLCSKVQENQVPFGEYYIIRSYRNITQLLVSVNTKIMLYTDRDNTKDSEIFITAYSRLDQVVLNVTTMPQHEFNITVEKLIRKGDNRKTATIPFPGGDDFIEEIKKGIKPEKKDGEYFLFIRENNNPVSLLTLDLPWKKLTLRNILNENKIPSTFYSIYINECYDSNINNILKEYIARIKK